MEPHDRRRLRLRTGDQDPSDLENERFDTLFGARRWEYGPTGIWGPIARANLNSPELRLMVQPTKTFDVMVAVRGVWLASERDTWTTTGLRDRTGASGTNIGQQYEARVRWDVVPRNFNIEVGGAYLAEGSFQDRASRDQGRDASYGYVQCTLTFCCELAARVASLKHTGSPGNRGAHRRRRTDVVVSRFDRCILFLARCRSSA